MYQKLKLVEDRIEAMLADQDHLDCRYKLGVLHGLITAYGEMIGKQLELPDQEEVRDDLIDNTVYQAPHAIH